MQELADALRQARAERRPIVLPYLMVDRRRTARLAGIVRGLARGGASGLELGFPFSDPIADGPTLEAASVRALRAGTAWRDLLAQLEVAREHLPTAVMTYANPVWHRGLATSLAEIRSAGGTGLIVPDLSVEESAPWVRATRQAGLALPLLVAPSADGPRVRQIARSASGFLYVVSRFGTTGRAPAGAAVALRPLVREAHRGAPDLPVLIGFGIRDRATARRALASGAEGVIVGSAVEERLRRGESGERLERWVAGLRS